MLTTNTLLDLLPNLAMLITIKRSKLFIQVKLIHIINLEKKYIYIYNSTTTLL